MTDQTLDPAEFDYSGLYVGESAPKDNPNRDLFQQLAAAAKTAGAEGPPPIQNPQTPGGPVAGGPDAVMLPVPGQSHPQPNPNSTVGNAVSPEDQALLERLRPFGVHTLRSLKTKTDIELRKLANDVLMREERERTLGNYFFRNPDGSYDFTRGPDGKPTGLGPDGKPLPKAAPPPPRAPGPAGSMVPPNPVRERTGPAPDPSKPKRQPDPLTTAPLPKVTQPVSVGSTRP